METAELLKKVRRIEIKTKDLSKHLFSGEYHSAFKGRGMSFSEVRSYQFGDDVRNIDWNVTARTGEPHIKIFEEERELTVMLLVDISGSAFYGTREQMKNEYITELAAVLAFSAINNDDKVGVIFFSDKIEKFIPPKKGRKHILKIIREFLDIQPSSKGTAIKKALEYFNNILKKRSIAFILSDFFDQGFEKPLQISAKRHDLIGVQLYDPSELGLANTGLIRVQDAESGKIELIDTSSLLVREHFKEQFNQNSNIIKRFFRKSGADFISLSTDHSYIDALHQFFLTRSKRMVG